MKSLVRTRRACLTCALAAAAALAGCATPAHGVTPAASATSMRQITATELARAMAPGINLGNTLEALPTETSWGQPLTTRKIMDAYKAAGFNTVRIPVAWFAHADANDRVDPAWMARVKQVVEHARAAGLYVMINTHWDNGWLNYPTYAKQAALNARLAGLWTQIANAFKDYDEHLLFAGTNEVGMHDLFAPPTDEYAAVQNSFNQTFVTTVRATGGNNATRHLIVQGYNTSIEHTVARAIVPKDTVADRLMMEVHYYDPYDFALNDKSKIWQWGAIAKDAAATQTWADEPGSKAIQRHAQALCRSRRAGRRGRVRRLPQARISRHAAVCAVLDPPGHQHHAQHGLVPVWWETSGLFDRNTGAQKEPEMIRAIVEAGR